MPVSTTRTRIGAPSSGAVGSTRTWTRPPSRVYLTALPMRFPSTCASRARTPVTSAVGGASTAIAMRLASADAARAFAASPIRATRSTGSPGPSSPASILPRSRRSVTSSVIWFALRRMRRQRSR